jgi:ABC-type transport system substrate-binding protein
LEANYWSRILQRRLTRRRAIAITAGAAGAAALLAACGGGDENAPRASSLLADKADTSVKAVRGGTFVWPALLEPLHYDGKGQVQSALAINQGLAYESLIRNKPGIGRPSTWSAVEPQLAESWEVSPDKLTITFKLRPGVKWHNKPPINGRALDAEDVSVTWQKFEASSAPNNKSAYSNKLNPSAPIISITAVNSSTVVVKMSEPLAPILQRFANMGAGEAGAVYPKEAGDSFDSRADQIGTGPYMLDRFTPSVDTMYKRNPNYWDPKAGFLDQVHLPLLPEYATRLAQLRAGAVSATQVSPEDVVATKRATPALAMYAITEENSNPVWTWRFGWLPIGNQPSPFLDIRVRQALSMSLDRKAYIDTFGNVSGFEAEGLPVNTYWHTAMGYVPEITLDPRDKAKFGENAKYYEYNVVEAKKLIAAALSAYPGGSFPEMTSTTVPATQVAAYATASEVMDQFAREIGFKVVANPVDAVRYNANYSTKQGKFTGYLFAGGVAASRGVTDYFLWRFYSKSGPTNGAIGFGGPNGSLGDASGDPKVDGLIDKLKGEFNTDVSRDVVHELQRHLAAQAYCVPRPGFADSFALAWPAIRNFATFQGDTRVHVPGIYGLPAYWYDSSLPHKA